MGSFGGASEYWGGALVLVAVVLGVRFQFRSADTEADDLLDDDAESEQIEPEEEAVTESVALRPPPLEAAPPPSTDHASASSKTDWGTLVRNAEDGGANSVLASYVLNKTTKLLETGVLDASEMNAYSEQVFLRTQEMLKFVADISLVSKSARLVAFNLMIEAGRHASGTGAALMVVAKEMTSLSEATRALTVRVEQKINAVSEVTHLNQKKCAHVSQLFEQVEKELSQFKFIMARIEELSVSQCQRIRSFEDKIDHGFQATNLMT